MKVSGVLYGVLSLLLCSQPAISEPDYNAISRKAYAMWECAALAGILDASTETGIELFNEGHTLFTVFVTAWKQGELNEQNTKDVPVGVKWRLTVGPSVDFSLGYMWAQFTEHAHNETWGDSTNVELVEKEKLQIARAEQAFRNKNCELLQN